MNQFSLVGNVGSGPQYWEEKGALRVMFSIAEDLKRKDQTTGEYTKVHTNWFRIKAFGKLASRVANHVKVGERVSISGFIRSYSFENSDGKKEYGFEVIANKIEKTQILKKFNKEPVAPSSFQSQIYSNSKIGFKK